MENKEYNPAPLSFNDAVKLSENLKRVIEPEFVQFIPFKENFDGVCANHVLDAEHIAFFGHDFKSQIMQHFIDVGYKLYPIDVAEPPFDMRKAVYDASTIDGNIYIHPLLFSSVYRYINENIDKPYSVDGSAYYMVGALNIVVTDLIPENQYCVLTEKDFNKKYNDKALFLK